MGNNFHDPWSDDITKWKAEEMNRPLSYLDRGITFLKNNTIACDGDVAYNPSTGGLSWSGTIHLYFNNTNGLATHNNIPAGSVTLLDNEFAFVTLSETNDATLTVSKAAIATGSASNFLTYNLVVLGYRNTADDNFYGALWGLILRSACVAKTLFDAYTILAANADNTPLPMTIGEQQVLGRLASGGIKGLSSAELATLIGYDLVPAPASDHVISGQKVPLTAAAAVAFGDVGRIDSTGKIALAKADLVDHAWGLFMCADESIAQDATGNWLTPGGIARDDSWDWVVGNPIYLSLTGTTGNTLTQTRPSASNNVIQIIGIATHADRMFFYPQLVQVEHV